MTAIASLDASLSTLKMCKSDVTRKILTATLFICFLTSGIAFSILPPTLLDIVQMINKEVKDVSMGFVGRSAAYSVSALICE